MSTSDPSPVRTLRSARGWTQEELARQASTTGKPISVRQVQRIENWQFKRGPEPETLAVFAAVFGCGVDELVPEGEPYERGKMRHDEKICS